MSRVNPITRKVEKCEVEGCRYGEAYPRFRLRVPESLRHFPFVTREPHIAQGSAQYMRVVNSVLQADTDAREHIKNLSYLAGFRKAS